MLDLPKFTLLHKIYKVAKFAMANKNNLNHINIEFVLVGI